MSILIGYNIYVIKKPVIRGGKERRMSDNIFKEIWTIGKFLLLAYALVWFSNSEKMWTDRITKKFLGVTYQEMDTQQATKRSVQIIKDTMED